MSYAGSTTPKRYPSKPFPFDSEYDFSFRPATYWPDLPDEEAVLSQVKGTTRRETARTLLDDPSEMDEEAAEFLLKPSLDDDELKQWARIHPANLGGEFLPELQDGEVEIARIDLASVTGDCYQLLARRGDEGLIPYRIVDEYMDDGSRHILPFDSSEQPLTLGELIELIDSERQGGEGWQYGDEIDDLGLFDRDREHNFDGRDDPSRLVNFATASSAFYPMLTSYYKQRANAWLEDARDRYARRSTPES